MGKILGAFIFIKARCLEPSTMASIASICALVGLKADPGLIQDVLNVGTLVFGALGFFVKESAALTTIDPK